MIQKRGFKSSINIFAINLLILTAFSVSSYSQGSSVTINVNDSKNLVPNTLYGTLMEKLGRQWSNTGVFVGTSSPIANTNGMRKDVIEAFKECGVGSIQWPGGCAAWSYEWYPPDPANAFGTDRFLQFCQLIGAEPIICGPHFSRSANSNVAWIKHIDSMTTKMGMDSLRWFKIGNEVWGGCGTGMDVATYCTNFNANYTPINNYRSSLKIEGCSQNEDRGYASVSGWFNSLISTLGNKMDAIEYHDYIFRTTWNSVSFSEPQYWQIMYDGTVGDFAGHIRTNVIPVMDAADPQKKIKIIVDEWGDWLAPVSGDVWMETGTLMNALSAANQLHLMMSHTDRIEIACIAQGVNVIHSLLNINTSSVMTKTPTFYVFKMFKPHHSKGAKWAPASSSNIETIKQTTAVSGSVSIPALTVGSTVDTTGQVNISVNNIDATSTRKITVNLNSSLTEYIVDSAQIITGNATNSENPFGGAENVNIKNFASSNYTLSNKGKTLTITLPARSIIMIRLKPANPVSTLLQTAQQSENFSVSGGLRGSLNIRSRVSQKTPLSIRLFSIDGKTLIESYSGTLEPGKNMFVWQPKNIHLGTNVYIVKIKAGDVTQSKRITL